MIRPSMLGRLERCPGSSRLEAELNLSDEQKSEAADRGTRLHEIISKAIKNPGDKISLISECESNEEIMIVESCLRAAESVWNSLSDSQRSRAIVRIEKKINLKDIGIDEGTPDLAIIAKPTDTEDGIIIILDWKTGIGYVPPARWNLQLMAYAVGSVPDITGYSAQLVIVQPMKSEAPNIWVASKEDLMHCKAKVKRVIDESEKEDSPLSSGAWCIYCKAKNNCPARALVAAEVQTLTDPVKIITALDGAARSALYVKLNEAVKILEKAKESIDEKILSGVLVVDGFEVGPGKAGRFWSKDTADVFAELVKTAEDKGVSGELYELISVSKMEKLLGKANVPEHLVASKPGNPTIKRSKN